MTAWVMGRQSAFRAETVRLIGNQTFSCNECAAFGDAFKLRIDEQMIDERSNDEGTNGNPSSFACSSFVPESSDVYIRMNSLADHEDRFADARKYPAGNETGAGMFIKDTPAEEIAGEQLRQAGGGSHD